VKIIYLNKREGEKRFRGDDLGSKINPKGWYLVNYSRSW